MSSVSPFWARPSLLRNRSMICASSRPPMIHFAPPASPHPISAPSARSSLSSSSTSSSNTPLPSSGTSPSTRARSLSLCASMSIIRLASACPPSRIYMPCAASVVAACVTIFSCPPSGSALAACSRARRHGPLSMRSFSITTASLASALRCSTTMLRYPLPNLSTGRNSMCLASDRASPTLLWNITTCALSNLASSFASRFTTIVA